MRCPHLFAFTAIAFVFVASCCVNAFSQTKSPNVVLILTDDMRHDFMSVEGHKYLQTPNIDRLANEGTLFTRCYVATPLCGPNRASIHTGLLAPQHGIINHTVHLGPEHYPNGNFLPGAIHDSGNSTCMIGKWFHAPHIPRREEYDRWFVHTGTNGPFTETAYTGRVFSVDGVVTLTENAAAVAGSPTTYATDIEFWEAARWATESASTPFFQFISPFAPHFPYTAAERHNGVYDGTTVPIRPNVNGLNNNQMQNAIQTYNNQCEMMLAVDEGVGHVYDQLTAAGILEDTIIIFTSDNGIHLGEHGFTNTKKTFFEETCRVPFVVRYGSNVAGQGPVDRHQLISHADLMMTIVELMGGTIPEPAKGTSYYGRSMAAEWLGSNGMSDVNRRKSIVLLRYHNDPNDNSDELDNDGMVFGAIVTDDGWKFADLNLNIGKDVTPQQYNSITAGLSTSLFNLTEDPFEINNLAGTCGNRARQIELQDRLTQQLQQYDAEFVFEQQEFFELGDVNQDNTVNLLDVNPFVDLVIQNSYQFEADTNSDCNVDVLDIAGFVSIVTTP